MEDFETFTLSINEPLCAKRGYALNAQFLGGNRIALNAALSRGATVAENSGDNQPIVHVIEEEFVYGDPTLRSLITESGSTFTALQALKQSGNNSEYIKISQAYRSIIRACLERLNKASTEAELRGDEELCKNYNERISIFYSIEFIWHLCEILCIDCPSSGVVIPQLFDWIRFHFSSTECAATELMMLGRDAVDSDNYWSSLTALIMQGQVEVTRALLQLHPSADSDAFKVADQILRTIPDLKSYSSSLAKFRSQWDYWMSDAHTKLASNLFSNDISLENIIKLITCDADIWNTMIKESDSWYELLPGYIFYTNPVCKSYELGDIANGFLNRWSRLKGNMIELKRLDYTLLHLFENNMKSVLHSLQLFADNLWFATHLVDLLHNCGQLQALVTESDIEPSNLRDSLLSEYGRCLMTRDSFWQLGIDYLELCSEGGEIIRILLLNMPLRTEKLAKKILAYFESRNKDEAVEEICKILSRKCYDQMQYGNALEWAIRSKDDIVVSNLADLILRRFAETGELCCLDVIANVGAKMFISTRLVFLAKYFEFQELYRKRDIKAATDILVNLLNSNEIPDYLLPTVFMDTLPLLQNKEIQLSVKNTQMILKHLTIFQLNAAASAQKSQNILQTTAVKDHRIDNIETFILRLRQSCAENLARAKIMEHSNNENVLEDIRQRYENCNLNLRNQVA